jgi:hypothetical protein
MLIITDDPVKKNGAKFWTCKKSCGLGVWAASMLFRQNNICMGAVLGSQYGAMAVAAEILIAQLHSNRVSLLRPDTKIEKFDTKTNF